MQVEDAIELRITMEEAQDLFCPPPSLKPTILTIEDIEFEAYHVISPTLYFSRVYFSYLVDIL